MFTYILKRASGEQWSFPVDVDRKAPEPTTLMPPWAALSFNRCPGCPLDPDVSPGCPPAVDMIEIIETLSEISSTEVVDVRVIGPQREYSRRCDVQMALRSLIGLVMASSACPHLSRFGGMARHHLPFSDRIETAQRTASAYLLEQYYLHRDGLSPDLELDGLRRLYERMQEVNTCFARRLRAAAQQDASVNAIAALSGLANLITFSLDDDLEELRRFLKG
ncbi:MAG: hypothetical protein ACI8S6_001764 [Myxococcota bacterium]|jgi:hypothetical protein